MSDDFSSLQDLATEIDRFRREALFKLVETGAEYMREEVPKITHRLERGVGIDVDYGKMSGEVYISAESDRRGARKATLHLSSGKTKQINLRPTKAYNYAAVVALGNKEAVLTPNKAKAFLIPITGPARGSLIEIDGIYYTVRRSRKGQKPNPFHLRAAERVESDAVEIVTKVAAKFFQ